MMSKLISSHCFKSLSQVIVSRKDLNTLMQFEFNDIGILLKCMDTYYTTQITFQLKAHEYITNTKLVKITSVNLNVKEVKTLIDLLNTHKSHLLITFDNDTDIQFKDPNSHILFVTLPYMRDNCMKYINTIDDDISDNSNVLKVKYLTNDLIPMLLNLCIANSVVHVDLEKNGQLLMQTFCEVGTISVEKLLHVDDNIHIVPFHSRFVIKYVKVLNNLIENISHFTFCLSKNRMEIKFKINSSNYGCFTLQEFIF